jgi:hypothetical protein
LEAKNNEAMQESGSSLMVYDIVELVEKAILKGVNELWL